MNFTLYHKELVIFSFENDIQMYCSENVTTENGIGEYGFRDSWTEVPHIFFGPQKKQC